MRLHHVAMKFDKPNIHFLIMRLTFILLLAATFHVSAYSYAQRISLTVKEATLEAVLLSIQKQSGYDFLFKSEYFSRSRPVTLDVKDQSIDEVLPLLMKSQPFDYKITGHIVTLIPRNDPDDSSPGLQQQAVRGKVTDSLGTPLEGVSVTVQGTSRGTVTNANGVFRIRAAAAEILMFQHIGFEPRGIMAGDGADLEIVLSAVRKDLDEVVVIGYGEVRKSDITGAVSSVKIGDEAKQRPAVAVSDLLVGKAAGVQIMNNSGIPGSEITFNIRGVSSFSDHQPLIVIDGVPVEAGSWGPSVEEGGIQGGALRPMVTNNGLASLNPNDIESIEILKDASATAIYGSRASNGVVLITTKAGVAGQDRIEYNFNVSTTGLARKYDMLNSADYMNFYNEASENAGVDIPFPQDSLYDQRVLENRDWQDLVYQQALAMDHQVSLTGGDERSTYRIIGNYNNSEGLVETSKFQRYGARVNYDRNFSKKLKFAVRSFYSESTSNAIPHSIVGAGNAANISIVSSALGFPPYQNVEWDSGIPEEDQNHPLTLLYDRFDTYKKRTLLGNVNLTYTILKGLSMKLNASYNKDDINRDLYYGQSTVLGRIGPNGYATVFNVDNSNYLVEYTLNFNRQFGKHRINAFAGYTWQEWANRSTTNSASDFPSDATRHYNFNLANVIRKPILQFSNYALASYIGRAVYSFDNRYVITATGRYDGSTRLAAQNRWAFFPSVGISWNAGSERFMKGQQLFSDLKLRASWGLSGNQVIPPGSSQAIFGVKQAVFGNQVPVGYIPTRFENNTLHWETASGWNWGVDMAFWKNRLHATVDYYIKDTRDQLGNYPMSITTGFSGYATNLGRIRNQGLEAEIGADLLTKTFKWNISGNISFNRNKVLDLGDLAEITQTRTFSNISFPIWASRVGQPMYMLQGFLIDGVYQTQEEADSGPVDGVEPNGPGSFRFVDVNGDNAIDDNDVVDLGSPFPDYTFGITNNLSYKSFGMSMLITGTMGQEIANLVRYRMDGLRALGNWNMSQEAYDNRWTGPGSSNRYAAPSVRGNPFNGRMTNYIVEDGSFIRLRSLTFTYQFPLERMGIRKVQQLKLFVTGTNLITITDYKGYDPEVSTSGSTAPGVDSYTAPPGRTFTAGVNIMF